MDTILNDLTYRLKMGSPGAYFYATVNAEIDASNEKENEAYNDFQFKKVRIIGDSKTAFEEFIVNAQSTEGIDNVLLI